MPNVAVFVGHMIDAPRRRTPRFPPRVVPAVGAAIRETLRRMDARIGFSSAACGSDILFLEAVRDLGPERELHIVLPYARDLFIADPVRYAPQFETWCAVSLARGELHEASPEYWLIVDDKLYLFGKALGPELFRKDYKNLLEQANRHRDLLTRKK